MSWISLVIDSASETLCAGIARIQSDDNVLTEMIACADAPAPRKANQALLPRIEEMLSASDVKLKGIDFVLCGRGPGSFTGVRIGIATAKGIACGLNCPAYGVSTLDAIAWRAHREGMRGTLGVVEDAMRKEVYPVRFELSDKGIERIDRDSVAKPADIAKKWQGQSMTLVGNGLTKYAKLFSDSSFEIASQRLWSVDSEGLVQAFCAQLSAKVLGSGDPALLLPVYTRLSDAEEDERARLCSRETMDKSGIAHNQVLQGTILRPLSINDVDEVIELQKCAMPEDAWTNGKLAGELDYMDRTWWIARHNGQLIACAGGQIVDGELCLFQVCVAKNARRQGIARALIERLAADAQSLAAESISLEVSPNNRAACSLYKTLGLEDVGVRPHYYHDGADACIMRGSLPLQVKTKIEEGASKANAHGQKLVGAKDGEKEPIDSKDAARTMVQAEFDKTNAQVQTQTQPQIHQVLTHEKPLILAIESSCDETAAAVINGKRQILAETVASQIDFHARFGGVVPEIASRKHTEAIVPTVMDTLKHASVRIKDLDAVAVTQGPGLVGALVVGIAFAKGLAFAANLPLIGVNHLEGHLYANLFVKPDITPPFVALLVSGGHTMLVHVKDWGNYEVLGSTLDDAVGEAFDKVAKALGLGYPGGPVISRYAADGNAKAIAFPRAMLHSGNLQFSLSGLKTAVVTYIKKQNEAGMPVNIADLAASFQAAVVDVQVAKALAACKQCKVKTFCMGGGVASNPALRHAITEQLNASGIEVVVPDVHSCTDNAAMIASVALDLMHNKNTATFDMDPDVHMKLRAQ